MTDSNKTLATATKTIASNNSVTVSFKRASINDRAFLLRLRKASMNAHLKSAGIFLDDRAHMQRIDEYFFDSYIILYQHLAIGLLKLGQFPDKIHVRQFQLLPKFHGLGIGSRILALVKQKAQAKQVAITLNVLLNNPAKDLYLRHGFVVTTRNELEFQMRWQGQYD